MIRPDRPSAPRTTRSVLDLPPMLRPRERLRTLGGEALGNRELLALILGTGSGRRSALEVSESLLPDEASLDELAGRGLDELAQVAGLGEAGACRIVAVAELARRMVRGAFRRGRPITRAIEVSELMRPLFVGERRERVHVLLLDARRRLLGERCISVGSLVSSIIHPREVFRPAITLAAASIVLVHNHPSGDPTPSVEDHQVTLRLLEAGALIGIELVDHVVVAADGYRSFREEGWLQPAWERSAAPLDEARGTE